MEGFPRKVALAAAFALAPAAPVLAADADDKGGRSGREVYETVCVACHGTGQLNAPRFGDAVAWKKLIAEGQRSLVRTALRGIRQMPPRGGNPSLTDREVERAVVHMANAAGGRFKEPR